MHWYILLNRYSGLSAIYRGVNHRPEDRASRDKRGIREKRREIQGKTNLFTGNIPINFSSESKKYQLTWINPNFEFILIDYVLF